MKLSAKKMREGCFNEKVYRWGTKFWRRIVCFALCVILFGANAVGTLAAEVPITETESQSAAGMEDVPPAEESTPPVDEEDSQLKNEDNLDVQITTWTWVDDEEFLTEYNETWYLGLPGLDMQQYTSEEL